METHTHLVFSDCESLQKIYTALLESFIELADLLRFHACGRKEAGTQNAFGDIQLECDTKSDEIIFNHLKKTGEVAYGLSEEQPKLVELGGNKYIVTFDPLDGSSIIGCNWTVGTIFGIWKNDEKVLIGHKTKDLIASGCCMYGPRTTAVIYNEKTKTVNEYSLTLNKQKQLEWILSLPNIVIKPQGKLFAPGNLRAASENPNYRQCINNWIDQGYTLRYTGGMVPDIYQIFIKGSGIFTTISSKNHAAKLRVLFEVAPLAHLVEMAKGKSSDGKNSLMELEITSYDQRSGIIVGSTEEVDKILSTLNQ
ncbi:hypothetical protein ABPG72_002269 [Tetrahymena utriculariae]